MEDIFRELLFLRKCHHSFLDKPYQELDFTRHLNSVLGRNTVRSADVSHDFISFICFCSRLCWSWKVPISILRLMKNYVRFQYVPWKMSVWVSFPLLRFTLVIRLRNFIWNWNTTTTKKIWCHIWICVMEKCMILFHS